MSLLPRIYSTQHINTHFYIETLTQIHIHSITQTYTHSHTKDKLKHTHTHTLYSTDDVFHSYTNKYTQQSPKQLKQLKTNT